MRVDIEKEILLDVDIISVHSSIIVEIYAFWKLKLYN
jgi:hypothetical protein